MLITTNKTKLRPPSRRGRLVDRPALLQRLCGQPRSRLSLIQAPAGFGKSSLLSQLYHSLRACGDYAAWLSIDAADNHADRFLQHLIAACRHISEALRQGCGGKLLRTFMDGGPRVSEVLAAAVNGAGSLPEAGRAFAIELLRAFESERRWCTPPSTSEGSSVPSAQLNRRELDILELAAGDVPNREIARRLALSENTVKWYWKRIFGKLCVRRRLQAVNSARAAGVIF